MVGRRAAFFALAALLLSAPLPAQTTPTRIRGTIERLDERMLVVAAREGGTASVTLPDPPRISAVVRKTLADIRPGTFVGVTGAPMPDGSQRAIAVALLPDAARANSFHSAWDLAPDTTMTNATVAETAKGVSGETLKVTYRDGEKTIFVPPEATIVGFVPASLADLKPGTRVVVFAQKMAMAGSRPATSSSAATASTRPCSVPFAREGTCAASS